MSDREHWDTQALSDAKAAAWSESEDRTEECINNIVTSTTRMLADGFYLDLGAGWGRLLDPLVERHPGILLIGADVSLEMIEAGVELRHWDWPVIDLVPGDGSLPWPSLIFDGVYSMLMFQHVTNEQMQHYIEEVARVLKHDGWFRFQFVEGTIYADYDRRRPLHPVLKWLKAAGLSVRAISHNLMYDDWCWITAVKP